MGYQRIPDYSELSLKSINDQLEQIWALLYKLLQAQ